MYATEPAYPRPAASTILIAPSAPLYNRDPVLHWFSNQKKEIEINAIPSPFQIRPLARADNCLIRKNISIRFKKASVSTIDFLTGTASTWRRGYPRSCEMLADFFGALWSAARDRPIR